MSELTLSERPVEKLCELIGLLKEIEKKVVNLEQSLAASQDENRKLCEQDRRNEITMGELRRAWEDQNRYIQHLRSRIDNLQGFSPQPPAEVIYRDGTVEQVETQKEGK